MAVTGQVAADATASTVNDRMRPAASMGWGRLLTTEDQRPRDGPRCRSWRVWWARSSNVVPGARL